MTVSLVFAKKHTVAAICRPSGPLGLPHNSSGRHRCPSASPSSLLYANPAVEAGGHPETGMVRNWAYEANSSSTDGEILYTTGRAPTQQGASDRLGQSSSLSC